MADGTAERLVPYIAEAGSPQAGPEAGLVPYIADKVANPNLSGRGRGKPGYCHICDALNKRPELRKQANAVFVNQKAPGIAAWLDKHLGIRPDRRPIYSHKAHMASPRDRFVSQVMQQQSQGTLPTEVTEDQFLRAVVAAGKARLDSEPESVTIDQAIKAAGALSSAKVSRQAGMTVLFATLTALPSGVPQLLLGDGEIEGETVEVYDQE